MGNGKYILDDNDNPIEVEDAVIWGKWFQENSAKRRVAYEVLTDCNVSTVFLGLDYSFGEGTPMLFETMVFGGKFDGEVERYSTREEALAGHEEMVKKIKAS
jgi:hypothetical protein